MNKMLAVIAHALLVTGMLYALITIVAVPAAACTTSQCDAIRANPGLLCQAKDGPNCSVGHVTSCSGSGFNIACRTAQGGFCFPVIGQCS